MEKINENDIVIICGETGNYFLHNFYFKTLVKDEKMGDGLLKNSKKNKISILRNFIGNQTIKKKTFIVANKNR
jgi:hypothetical protein